MPAARVDAESAPTALPCCFPQLAALLGMGQDILAERLLQDFIRHLSSSVPPQAPQLREWLLLALFSLLHGDVQSGQSYLNQAQREWFRGTLHGNSSRVIEFTLQLTRCLTFISAQRSGDADELLDQCESDASTACDPARMWLVLQLRTATSLLQSHSCAAWGTWQAAMAIQRTQGRAEAIQGVPASAGDWLKMLADEEEAVGLN
ncbi:MAG: hypothetical protein ACKO2P_08680 [Planctomycetota bacterium]